MNAVVMQMFQPDISAMAQHVEHLFGGFLDGYHEGKIELAWTNNKPDEAGRYKLKHAEYFDTDQLDELVQRAVELNSVPMTNVYIGAALRHPDTAPFGRSKDSDAWALTASYVDLDDPGAAGGAKDIYGINKPTMVVQTGREPYLRAQCWWRLSEPLTDQSKWPAALRGMAVAMHGDTTVTNPSRVMRLAGTVAWPVKEGRMVELTCIRELKNPGQPVYSPDHLTALFPPVTEAATGVVDTSRAVTTQVANGLGLTTDKLADSRERYMRDTVVAVLIEYIGTNGALPSEQELFDAAWPQYERAVDFSRPGRGPKEFAEKCAYTIKRFERGEIRGVPDLDSAIAVYQRKQQARALAPPKPAEPQPAAEAETDEPIAVGALSGEPKPREWFVKDWIPAGVVTALYGDGGTGKTLLAQQLLYAAGVGGPWLGIDVPKCSGLGVFCEDDADELHRRHNDIKTMMGYTVGNPFTETWIWPRVGYDNLLVTFDKNNLPSISPFFQRVMNHVMEKRLGFLVLDTVADLFGGNEIIRGQVTFFIKAVCGRFVKDAKAAGFILTVLILAHPSQSGRNTGTGESGSTAWNNSVRSRLYLTRDDAGGTNDRVLTRKKSNYSAAGDGETIPLEWRDGALVPRTSKGGNHGLPPWEVCRDIITAIQLAWDKGVPLSLVPQSRSEGRFAPLVLSRKFPVRADGVANLLESWLSEGVLSFEKCNTHTKLKGLRVAKSI